jgi:hypothetical protein
MYSVYSNTPSDNSLAFPFHHLHILVPRAPLTQAVTGIAGVRGFIVSKKKKKKGIRLRRQMRPLQLFSLLQRV